ncbi:MAG: hypothetical protein OIF57_08715 [Marinobacterium sp.]|nr:hypothetical protein [Marinobacterium sp.]
MSVESTDDIKHLIRQAHSVESIEQAMYHTQAMHAGQSFRKAKEAAVDLGVGAESAQKGVALGLQLQDLAQQYRHLPSDVMPTFKAALLPYTLSGSDTAETPSVILQAEGDRLHLRNSRRLAASGLQGQVGRFIDAPAIDALSDVSLALQAQPEITLSDSVKDGYMGAKVRAGQVEQAQVQAVITEYVDQIEIAQEGYDRYKFVHEQVSSARDKYLKVAEEIMNKAYYAEFERELGGLKTKLLDARAGYAAGTLGYEAYDQVEQVYAVRYREVADRLGRYAVDLRNSEMEKRAPGYINYQAEMIRYEDRAEEAGQAVLSQLFSESPVSGRQAMERASQTAISGHAEALVANAPRYNVQNLKSDLVHLYRLAGTAAGNSSVELETNIGMFERGLARTNATRSFYMHNPGTVAQADHGFINVGMDFCRPALFHEYGHHLEAANPVISAMALAFLHRRAAGEQPSQLSQLTGGNYRDDEIAIKDSFVAAYVGKIYQDSGLIQGTEVISMGLEHFASARSLGALMRDDPEHFALIVAALRISRKEAPNA